MSMRAFSCCSTVLPDVFTTLFTIQHSSSSDQKVQDWPQSVFGCDIKYRTKSNVTGFRAAREINPSTTLRRGIIMYQIPVVNA